jgi:hypothetical protein
MALKPGTREFEQWRKKNFNTNINVPKSAIDKLMKGGTPSTNIKKYAGTNDRVMREAMNRFYGKGWESKASGSTSKPSTPTTPPRNVPSSITSGKKTYGVNTPSPRIAEGRAGVKPINIPASKKAAAQRKLDALMRSPQYRPTTSIGSFNPNARVLPTDFSYSKLNPSQKAVVNEALFAMLPIGAGIGIGLKAIRAIKGAVTATKFAKAVKAEQAAVKTAKVAKTAKKTAKPAPKKPTAPKNPAPKKPAANKPAAKKTTTPKKPVETPKRGRPSSNSNPYGLIEYSDATIINMAKGAPKTSRYFKEMRRRGLTFESKVKQTPAPKKPSLPAPKNTAKPKNNPVEKNGSVTNKPGTIGIEESLAARFQRMDVAQLRVELKNWKPGSNVHGYIKRQIANLK